MPRNPKYPLEPLREHRDRHVDAATTQLASAVETREAAEEAQRSAEDERREADARAAVVRRDEAALLASGELRVADLARAQAWEHAATTEIAALEQAVARATADVRAATNAEGEARAELARKMADLDMVTKDKARFLDRVRRTSEAVDEEAVDDMVAARRRDG
jgi:hypothetical protein